MTNLALASLAAKLFPICRSITGRGVRETLAVLAETIPLKVEAVASGTKVLDWEVPEEWTPRSAVLRRLNGEVIVDFAMNNLHLLQYSISFSGKVSREELEKHLFSLPGQPTLIPYKTSYYKKDWGFCLTEEIKKTLTDEFYEVSIDTTLEQGALHYGEFYIAGETDEEILISTHICHPSLANDNLSGILVALALAQHFSEQPNYYAMRFVFVPGTIGAITWLARNQESCRNIRHGLVLTGLGAGDSFHYKKTRQGDAVIDQLVANTLKETEEPYHVEPFSPYGYDERQYNSPGFALPVGCFMRTPYGTYPEYHTSADNLDFLKIDLLERSIDVLRMILNRLCENRTYRNELPFGEPQLGRRGLYGASPEDNLALLWMLNLSDGQHSVLEISERSGISFAQLQESAVRLRQAGVLTLLK